MRQRRITTYLVTGADGKTQSIQQDIFGASNLWRLPDEYYPLMTLNQAVLRFYIDIMPTTATFLDVVPVSYESQLASAGSPVPGFIVAETILTRAAGFQYDALGSPSAGIVTPNLFRIRRTAIDQTLDGLVMGTRHPLPLLDDHIAFLATTDGTAGTGSYSLFLTIGVV